jgi:hypothetical protein
MMARDFVALAGYLDQHPRGAENLPKEWAASLDLAKLGGVTGAFQKASSPNSPRMGEMRGSGKRRMKSRDGSRGGVAFAPIDPIESFLVGARVECRQERAARRLGLRRYSLCASQDDALAASQQLCKVADQLRPKLPKLAALMSAQIVNTTLAI